ncbi:MAG: hypothetical protein JNK47_24595 [Mesorhizobium sp.]|nr:hypothetical protein [Mesorhizobium sp.]MBL8580387.1 hypothetical protein [Mesorhizobium sp.]
MYPPTVRMVDVNWRSPLWLNRHTVKRRGDGMVNVLMKASFLAGFVVATLPVGLVSAQERTWIGQSYEEGAALIYGIPDSGDMTLSFDCARNSDTLTFIYAFEPGNASDRMQLEVRLQTADTAIPVATTGTRLEIDDLFVLEGELKLDEITGLLKSRGVLRVFVENGSEEIPLDGAREAAKSLLETCTAS